jgi:hypothetical protein
LMFSACSFNSDFDIACASPAVKLRFCQSKIPEIILHVMRHVVLCKNYELFVAKTMLKRTS